MTISSIILAAGKGTRMKSALPKVMHKVASRSMIGHILDLTKSVEIKETIVVIGPDMEELEQHILMESPVAKCVVQEKRLGTGDAVKVGVKALKNSGDVLVLYGDTPFLSPNTIEKMKKLLNADKKNALVVLGFTVDDETEYGRLVVNSDDELEKIVEYLDCDLDQRDIDLCNSGVMLINGKYINELLGSIKNKNAKKEYYLTDLVEIAREKGLTCQYVAIDYDEAIAINSREELVDAEYVIQTRMREKFIKNGVTLIDPETVYFSRDTEIERDVVIYPNVFFGPAVKVKSGVTIKSFSHLEDAIIGKNSVVGPFANLRPGTVIEEKAKIGNFVEVKNSHINSGSKINHLSYIGDAEIGKGVNIGAGTITCNYDGVSKHKTTIGDNSFIGSNSVIVAPMNIGQDSLVAAGSTLTKDVESGALAVARADQKNIPKKAKTIKEKKSHDFAKNPRKAL